MDQNYRGLANLGATCYMNSLLQTLFMTPQFREAVYQWKYNEKVHPEPSKSILYQIQKLFGKLQKSYPGEITTKELIKSFDWQDQQAQMQQDIQQFNRVLFEALQKSLSRKKNGQIQRNHFVRQLYEGQMLHYTHCKECENQSQREEIFQDIIVTVKNPYEKIYNKSVQLGLQRYMKPEILDENNLYFCEGCNKKVQAQRGLRFLKLPKLLNIILRRFDFDYYTYQRIKVNDRVQFPFVLNFNNYMQGYDNIPEKLNQDSSDYFKSQNIPKKNFPSSNTTNAKKVPAKKKPLVTNIVGKKTTKPSTNTKSFLQDMRKRKMMSQEQNDDLIYISGSSEPIAQTLNKKIESSIQQPSKIEKQVEPLSKSEEIQLQKQSPEKKNQNKEESKIIQEKKQVSTSTKCSTELPLPPILDLPPPQLSQPYAKIQDNGNEKPLTMQEELQKKFAERKKLDQQKEQKLKELQIKNQQLIAEYLKEGPLVYELYSVLVHNGSAGHGHYFSYIKSFEDHKWYCFNDSRVYQVNVQQIQQTFGGSGTSNAYALYYRQVQSENYKIQRRVMIPAYIDSVIEDQILKFKVRQNEKIENLENILILKIHYQLYVQQLEIMKNSSLELCLQKARDMFSISEDSVSLANSRLRMYNPVSDTKLQTFTGREKLSLEELKISSFKTMIIETKKQNEEFQEFIVGKIFVKIVLWEINGQNLQSLDQSHLKCYKVSVTKNSKMKQVQEEILKRRKQILEEEGKSASENICIVKRHQNDEYSYHEVINMPDYIEKTLDQLMVIDNEILFIEPDSNNLMWPQEFQNQIYRINIRYNNPQTGKIQMLLTDSRKTLGELKQIICNLIGYNPDQTIMRSGSNKSGLELKILSMTMKDAKFITGKMLFIEKGIPAKQGEIRIQLFIAYDAPVELYNRLHQFEFIADVPINKQWKASQVKELFMKIVKRFKNMDLEKGQFRIRQKVADKIGKIYRQRPLKEQQLIEKREIAIEIKADQIETKEFSVYLRVWDPQDWTLSQKIQLFVTKNTTMLELGAQLCTIRQNISVQNIEICRILSIHKFNILDLCEMEYFSLTETSVIAEPLFVNTDGLLFIVKVIGIEPRQLTKEEEIKFGGKIKQLSINNKQRMNRNYVPKAQKGVSIRVTANKQQQEEEQSGQKE